MLESINGLATYDGAARLLGLTYSQVQKHVKRHGIQTLHLVGSNAVLIRLSDLAQLRKPTAK